MAFSLTDPFYEDSSGIHLRLSGGNSVLVTPTVALDANGVVAAPASDASGNGAGSSSNPLFYSFAPAVGLQVAKVTVTGKTLHAAAGAFAWANPLSSDIVVTSVRVKVRTIATGTCLLDVGVAANGTTLSDTLLDGIDAHAATGFLGIADQAGANGKAQATCPAGQFVTGSAQDASSDLTGLVADVYIYYHMA